MASIPDFDPNNYHTYNIENFRNRVISDAYEPGSTFKIIPLALSLEKNTFSLSDSIYCEEGEFLLSSNKKLHDHEPHALLSLEDIMAYSSNIGFAKLSESFNNDDLYKFLKYFGFGTKSFISLNNESQGIIRNTSNWSKTSKNYISIGQELSITNLQLALAYSAIANGGFLVRPNIVKNVMNISTENIFNKLLGTVWMVLRHTGITIYRNYCFFWISRIPIPRCCNMYPCLNQMFTHRASMSKSDDHLSCIHV